MEILTHDSTAVFIFELLFQFNPPSVIFFSYGTFAYHMEISVGVVLWIQQHNSEWINLFAWTSLLPGAVVASVWGLWQAGDSKNMMLMFT